MTIRGKPRVLTQEGFCAPSIFLPTLPEPRPNGTLDPEFLIVQKFLQDLQRLVEFARPDIAMERISRCSSPPDVLRASRTKDITKSRGPRAHHPRDRPGRERIA